MSRPAEQLDSRRPQKRPRERKRRPFWLIWLIIALLLQIIPAIVSGISSVVDEFGTWTAGQFEHNGIIQAATPDAPATPTDFPHEGIWQLENGMQLALSPSEDEAYGMRRYLATHEGHEAGYYDTYLCLTDEGWEFPETFPAAQYDWWLVQLYPQDWMVKSDTPYALPGEYGTSGGALSIFQSRENPAEVHVLNQFGEIPWLAAEASAPATQIASAAEADKTVLAYSYPAPLENT